MAAPCATQFIALRNLSRNAHQVRQLHMTGPASYVSPALTQERPLAHSSGHARSSKQEEHSDDPAHPRAFSSAHAQRQSKRPAPSVPQQKPIVRHFNTSRANKAVNDTSTMDFAYLPSSSAVYSTEPETFRVPILPNNFTKTTNAPPEFLMAAGADDMTTVMKPQISSMSADAVYLPMAELSDDHAMHVDFHALAGAVSTTLMRTVNMQVPVEEQAGLVRQIWKDLMDDVLGTKGPGKAPAV